MYNDSYSIHTYSLGFIKTNRRITMDWEVDHALVWVAIISALGGTFLAAVELTPGIEYDIQKEKPVIEKNLYMVKMIQLELHPLRLVNYIIVWRNTL